MKFTILFASCLIFAIIRQADSGLVKDFFGKVQKTAEVVREDVRKVWRPVTGTESSTSATPDDKHEVATPVTNKQEVATPVINKQEVATPASNKPEVATPATNAPEVKPADKKENGNVAPLSGESDKKSEEVSKPSSDTIKPEEKEENHQEASTISPSTTTVKEGRENFKAKCATGYGRTPDGRCKPTF